MFAPRGKGKEPLAEPRLGLPGNVDHILRKSLLPLLQRPRYRLPVSILLGCLNEGETQVAVARLCYLPPAYRVPRQCSEGMIPMNAMYGSGEAKRLMSPVSAAIVAAVTAAMPRIA